MKLLLETNQEERLLRQPSITAKELDVLIEKHDLYKNIKIIVDINLVY